ncbi:MAG TPA: division/cell wall cluster transcriptional repressor MraZ [Bacteroidetes bacterium]|nr:division/cell wall cluster transcriptional repressor MraZ [Bacteroidota bacterium]HRR08421.1 division/cell wall cluster transcriptional repressor MraZ [Rhodothermales bacterium]
MAGFKGQADYSVDAKGRVALPAKMRRVLSPAANDTFVLTRGIERCVYLYPLDVWNKKEAAEFEHLNQYEPETRAMLRSMYRWADEETLDAQGRVIISKRLIEFAGIADKVTIIGALDRIEIWNPDVLTTELAEEDAQYGARIQLVMGKREAE